jgi:nitrate/TMAO reductase-like tetraheme cytochrome c subunit
MSITIILVLLLIGVLGFFLQSRLNTKAIKQAQDRGVCVLCHRSRQDEASFANAQTSA